MQPFILDSIKDTQTTALHWKKEGHVIGFVPTMGALHAGHLSLIERSNQACQKTILSIFVNPSQFGPKEDFAKYPRRMKEDLELVAKSGLKVDLVFLPDSFSMYPNNFNTWISHEKFANELCGAVRPGHFKGVLTIVLKLLHITAPDQAFFGKKDYQQYKLISQMVENLNMNIEIVGCPIIRDKNGLALSSRNEYLSEEQQLAASKIYMELSKLKTEGEKENTNIEKLVSHFKKSIEENKEMQVEYIDIRDAESFDRCSGEVNTNQNYVALTVVHYQGVRLLDNIEFEVRK